MSEIPEAAVEALSRHRWVDVLGDNDDPVHGKFFGCSCGWTHRVDGMWGYASWRAAHDAHVAERVLHALRAEVLEPVTAIVETWEGYGHGEYNVHYEDNLLCPACKMIAALRAVLADPDAVAK